MNISFNRTETYTVDGTSWHRGGTINYNGWTILGYRTVKYDTVGTAKFNTITPFENAAD